MAKAKKEEAQLPKMQLVERDAKARETYAAEVMAGIEALAIADDASYREAGELVAEVKAKRAEWEEDRRAITDPLNGVVKLVNSRCKPAVEFLDRCEAALKRKIAAYANARAAERDRHYRVAGAAGAAGDAEAATEALSEASAAEPPRLEGVSMREVWSGEVVDASKIPREFLVPDLKALLAVTRARGGDPGIPGWRAFSETSVSVRST